MNLFNKLLNIDSIRYDINYYLFDFWQIIGDPRNRHYPLMSGGPWPLLSIIFLYLIFVTKIGPQFMKNRAPFQLKKVSFLSFN